MIGCKQCRLWLCCSFLLVQALLAAGCEDAKQRADDEIEDASADVAVNEPPADADSLDSELDQPSDAGTDADAVTDARADARSFEECDVGPRPHCPLCPRPCAAGLVWDIYVCNCINPNRCDNGWVLCNHEVPVCFDGKCVECARDDSRYCSRQDAGLRCDTQTNKCVLDCPAACPPGTDRDPETCECFDFCADGCDPTRPACFNGKCVECTETQADHCPSQRCAANIHECY